jgi:4-hydroxymandelate oxidase
VPGWSPRAARTPVIPSDKVRSVNMIGQPIAKTAYDPDRKGLAMFPTNFKDLEWLVHRCAMPVVVKGVLRGDDAGRCVDCGVKGIMVSNHGGRHLDTTVTTAEVLAEVVEAVGASAEVYVDGGIRRGTDIVKALALGARAVLLGRPPLWGLSVDGADGVAAVLTHMHQEMVRAMQLCGANSLAALTRDLVKA